MNIAFIGLGVMGFPMASHLSKAGHNLSVFNRTTNKAERWTNEYSGIAVKTPAQAAIDADFVISCVGNDNDVIEVINGADGAALNAKPGTVFIDHTTASAECAISLSEALKEKGISFIDAPVSGGEQGAIKGQLTIMCGGEQSTFERAKPIMDCYAKAVTLMGGNGSGQLTKMVNQIAIAGLIQSLAEAIQFAKNAGLDIEQVIDVIGKGAAQSWQMENRYKTMHEGFYEHGFAVDWMRKDLSICMNEARKNGSSLPVAALIDQFYAEIQANGGGRWDTSSLLTRLSSKKR